ncbi:unnamed protein product (macronuclear) [Paramecium tetraurelia]|uniref:RING-type domain-containing protein n=1 Tax=Paramecium tetraurelia TaxID=5888 RepID=A0BWP8_PARTE|nr:uncharacterized protein GSPATT00032817001 [Paramecium tetraurelia]CAK62965.1 unnamed protein product [Paramecium tetraurelia]|eukprot:XP_001430363.1 hypothetical protein (macronuclear) [Paramecium tetraurelia strain d4-2]
MQMQETQLYRKSANHFNVSNSLQLLYCFTKISFGTYLLLPTQQCNYTSFSEFYYENPLHKWIAWIVLHSILNTILYFNQIVYMNVEENRRNLAQKLDQIRDQEEQFQAHFIEDSKQISILTRQIKYEVQKSVLCGKWYSRLLGIIYQLLFLYGLAIFLSQETSRTGCEYYQYYFLCTILILSIYQYIDLYIIAIFCILFSPFLILFLIYYCVSHCTKRQQKREAMERLNIQSYKPNCVEGDPECTICRCAYELGENILTLTCSKFHHFHESCIMSWMNVNSTCPLCRKAI